MDMQVDRLLKFSPLPLHRFTFLQLPLTLSTLVTLLVLGRWRSSCFSAVGPRAGARAGHRDVDCPTGTLKQVGSMQRKHQAGAAWRLVWEELGGRDTFPGVLLPGKSWEQC